MVVNSRKKTSALTLFGCLDQKEFRKIIHNMLHDFDSDHFKKAVVHTLKPVFYNDMLVTLA